MLIYRIKQFYWAIESIFIKDDFELLKKYLNESELSLFMNISKSERQHSIRVCKTAVNYIELQNIEIDEYIMCKCALLHDVGKAKIKLNILYKSIIVIINKITNGRFLKYNKNKRIVDYYNHPRIGSKLLEGINEESLEVIICTRYHHNDDFDNFKENKYLEILRICDNCN